MKLTTATRVVTGVLTSGALAVSGLVAGQASAAPGEGLEVRGLTVEHLAEPLGIDLEQPLLGWQLTSSTPDAEQSAYEIEVATDAAFEDDAWNTGKVTSDRSTDVVYAGEPLRSQTVYHWRVRVWDELGSASPWSEPATFETAFVGGDDLGGDWIGSPTRRPEGSLSGASWIWYPEGNPSDSAPIGTRYLRRTFSLPAGSDVESALLQVTADDYFTLYVNGSEVLASPTSGEAWRTIRVTDVRAHLHAGQNTVAVAAQNAGTGPGPAGVVGRLDVRLADATTVDIATDDQWVAANSEHPGWETEAFDDSAWPAARAGATFGQGPWGNAPSAPVPPEPLLRRAFELEPGKEVASARAYVAGLGYYKLYLNGERVGDHELDPGFTVYDDTVLYATHDVTDALRSGGNALGVSLGRGYFGQLQPDEWVSSPWHDDPKLKLELAITYTDGSKQHVVSDTDWLAGDGPTTSESVWFGESYDARREQPGWTTADFDDSDWHPALTVSDPGGELRSQLFPAIEVTDELPVVETTQVDATTTVYDFGVPIAGWATVELSGPAGAEVKMVYGEKLKADGTVNNDNVYFTVQNYSYTLKGEGTESFRPSYSYAGYRYLQVVAPAGVTVTSVTGQRVHSAVERVGDFSSDSDLLDRYDEAQADTILNNLHSVPTDTPMYEKRPYTADGFLMADSAIATFDMQGFLENWARAHRDDQTPEGTFGNTVPGTVGSKNTPDPLWSSSYVEIAWDLYEYYGSTRALADNYDGLKRWLDHYEAVIAETGNIYTGFSYGDWLSPQGAFPPEGTRLTATAYLYRAATLMTRIAGVLGHDADAAGFEELAASIHDAFNDAFYDAGTGAYVDKPEAGYRQTSNVLPLRFGLVPPERRATVLESLVDDIEERGGHLNTGAIGTKELLPVLTENGHADLAYTVATNPTYPGWGYWFEELGAQTMWEEWGEHARSHNHAFLGTVVDWQYQHVAGITPAAPGYREIRIQPFPMSELDHAQATVDSPYGPISSSWTRGEGQYVLDVTVPVGSTAEVYVPVRPGDVVVPTPAEGTTAGVVSDGFQRFTVGSGEHRFVAAPATELRESTVTVTPTRSTRPYGAARSFAVQVTGDGGVPTGSVSLREGSVDITSAVLDDAGRATLRLPRTRLDAGVHSLEVVYSGDATFAPSSTTIEVRVRKIRPTVAARPTEKAYRRTQTPVLVVRATPAAHLDGTVSVAAGRRTLVSRVRLVDGKARVRLGKASRRRGPHVLTVVYTGGTNTARAVTTTRYRIR